MKKNLIWGIIIFLMLLLTSVNAKSVLIKEITIVKNEAEPIPIFDGILGDNDWYTTPVTITFIYDPYEIKEIWYSINDGEFQKYEGPFNISIEGQNIISWYYINIYDEQYFGNPFLLKIDLSSPIVKISKIPGINQVIFTANADDNASGIARVEFYLDDEFQATDNESPYKWTYKGTESHIVYAKAYNTAGLFNESEKISTPRFISTSFFNLLIEFLQKIIFTLFS